MRLSLCSVARVLHAVTATLATITTAIFTLSSILPIYTMYGGPTRGAIALLWYHIEYLGVDIGIEFLNSLHVTAVAILTGMFLSTATLIFSAIKIHNVLRSRLLQALSIASTVMMGISTMFMRGILYLQSLAVGSIPLELRYAVGAGLLDLGSSTIDITFIGHITLLTAALARVLLIAFSALGAAHLYVFKTAEWRAEMCYQ